MTTTLTRPNSSLLKLSWPILLELLLQILVGNVDQLMISHYSQPAVAAIGNANQIINIVIILLTVTSTANTILLSQYLGARNNLKIAEICTVSLVLNALFSLITSVVLLLFGKTLLQWLQVPVDILEEASLYLKIVGGGIILQGIYFSLVSSFRGFSYIKMTLVVSIIMNIFHVGSNYVLIFGMGAIPALGVLGVSISTNLSKFLGLVILLVLFFRYLKIELSWRYLKPFPWDSAKKILSIAVPSGAETLSYQLSQTFIMKIVNVFGLIVINTKIYVYIMAMFCYSYALAISAAMQIVMGYLIGEKNFGQVSTTVWKAIGIATLITGLITTTLYFNSDIVFRIFTDNEEILKLGQQIFFIEIFLEIGRAVNIVMVRALQAAGDIKTPVTVGIGGMWFIAVLGAYILGIVLNFGLVGVWIAMALDEIIRALIFIYRWQSGRWQQKILIN